MERFLSTLKLARDCRSRGLIKEAERKYMEAIELIETENDDGFALLKILEVEDECREMLYQNYYQSRDEGG